MRALLNSIFAILLFGVLKWAFNSFAWDATVHILQSKFGIAEADVIAAASSFVVPGIIAFLAIAGAYNVGKRFSGFATPSPMSLPSTGDVVSPGRPRPFIIQAAIILVIVSGGMGYTFNRYVSGNTVDLAAIKSAYANFRDYSEVYRRHYSHESVMLDGLRCHECSFDNVTFVWHGTAPYVLEQSIFVPDAQGGSTVKFQSDNPIVFYTMEFVKRTGGYVPGFKSGVFPGPM